MRVDVVLTPTRQLSGDAGMLFIVVDVLRTSTTLCTALAHGAKAIVPFPTPEEAREFVQRSSQPVLLAGEQEGQPIPGFELENSPVEYTPERVAGRIIAFVSSNGAPLLRQLPDGEEVRTIVAGLVNNGAVLEYIWQWRPRTVLICCAGNGGAIAYEDVVGAGAIVEGLRRYRSVALTDAAHLAAAVYREAASNCFAVMMRCSRHARFLALTGRERDVEYTVQRDRFWVVPRWFSGMITAEPSSAKVASVTADMPECAA